MITKQQAINIAERFCRNNQIQWVEPVDVWSHRILLVSRKCWFVYTAADVRGQTHVYAYIDMKTGKILGVEGPAVEEPYRAEEMKNIGFFLGWR